MSELQPGREGERESMSDRKREREREGDGIALHSLGLELNIKITIGESQKTPIDQILFLSKITLFLLFG